jgi:HemY protein
MARAVHAAHDPVWTADGVIAERWMPVSPVTGRLDAFQWRVPVADLTPPRGPVIEPEAPVERAAPVAVRVAGPVLPAVAEPPLVDVTPAPATPAPLTPKPEPKPVPKELARLNGPVEPTLARRPDDPGPAAPEPGLDPVPKPSSEFSRGLVK